MKAAIIIPARMGATRLPGKPLLAETGKPLIQHVYEQARRVASADQVFVATDDAGIRDAVSGFGGATIMTGEADTGTARVAEAAADIDAEIIVNLQGDEPEIDPAHIDRLIALQAATGAFASTLACPFPELAQSGSGSPDDPAAVKAILGDAIGTDAFWARYFTRAVCAWPREDDGRIAAPSKYFLHIGVYAFSRTSLAAFTKAPAGALETSERLEQLRILEMGEQIAVGIVSQAAPGIDTPQDYERFVARVRRGAAKQ